MHALDHGTTGDNLTPYAAPVRGCQSCSGIARGGAKALAARKRACTVSRNCPRQRSDPQQPPHLQAERWACARRRANGPVAWGSRAPQNAGRRHAASRHRERRRPTHAEVDISLASCRLPRSGSGDTAALVCGPTGLARGAQRTAPKAARTARTHILRALRAPQVRRAGGRTRSLRDPQDSRCATPRAVAGSRPWRDPANWRHKHAQQTFEHADSLSRGRPRAGR